MTVYVEKTRRSVKISENPLKSVKQGTEEKWVDRYRSKLASKFKKRTSAQGFEPWISKECDSSNMDSTMDQMSIFSSNWPIDVRIQVTRLNHSAILTVFGILRSFYKHWLTSKLYC